MVLGLLLREDEERALAFDFEAMLPDEAIDRADDDMGSHGGRKDFKRGTVVCRHWLRALCMKGDNCEFLHQYDMSKMPECRWGMECQVPECPFRHVPDEERVECAFYRQGFCSHGASCRYRHIKLAREECPEIADFTLQSKVADEENVKRRKAQPVNEFYKIAICKHWEKLGHCPFNDECHFAHGENELRPFPKGEKDAKDAASMGRNDHHGPRAGRGPPGSGGGPMPGPGAAPAPPPALVLPDENKLCKYFLVQSQSYHNVAHSVHFNKWSVPQATAQALKLASETSDDVFLIVTVGPSKHFQGVVRLAPGAMLHAGAETGEDLAAGIVPYEHDGRTQWSGAFSVEWLRICECPWERLQQFEQKHLVVPECPNGMELEADVGHALVRLLFNQAPIKLHYKSVEDEQQLPGGAEALAVRRREAAESLVRGGPGGFGPPPRWQATTPGFVFTCTTATIDECFGRLVFGLSKDHEAMAMQHVAPGTPLFLLNLSDRHVLGIFEAVSPVVPNMFPGAFSTAGPQAPSPLPVQVRFAVMLNAPAISPADPQLQQIFGDRGAAVGPLSLALTQRLADVFAERCAGGPMFAPPKGGMPPHMAGGGPPSLGNAGAGPRDLNAPLLEKLPVGIENDNEFNVTRRIIGHAGANMKRIMAEAGGNAKVRVRGRGSGSKENGVEEQHEPLVVLVSADNERSLRIACELASELLAGVHHDYRNFLAQKGAMRPGGGGGNVPFHGGFPSGPPPFRGGGGGGGGGFPMMRGNGPPSGPPFMKQEAPQ